MCHAARCSASCQLPMTTPGTAALIAAEDDAAAMGLAETEVCVGWLPRAGCQKFQPGGGGPHEGSGCQPLAGAHPRGAGGQFGGATHTHCSVPPMLPLPGPNVIAATGCPRLHTVGDLGTGLVTTGNGGRREYRG